MGFLDFLKGKSSQIRKEKPKLVADLDEISELVSKKSLKAEKEMNTLLFPKFAEIKHLLKEIRIELAEIESSDDAPSHSNERINKMAITSKSGFITQMNSLLEKLAPPQTNNLQEIEKYCSTSSELMNREIVRFRKNIVLTGFIAKEPVKRIGQYISELSTTLNKISEENSLKIAAHSIKVVDQVSKINDALTSIKNIESKLNQSELDKNKLISKINSAKIELTAIKTSDAHVRAEELMQALSEIENEKSRISRTAIDTVAPIEKPLRRMLKISQHSGTLTTDEWQIITLYLESPVDAVKRDPKAETLKSILSLLIENINNGTISLKEKEIPKKIAAITELQEKDLFGELFWKLNDIEVRAKSLQKELSENEILLQIDASTQKISLLNSQLEETRDSIKKNKSELQSRKNQLTELKSALENYASLTLNSEVEISLSA